MKTICVSEIVEAVEAACIACNKVIDPAVRAAFDKALEQETSPVGQRVIQSLVENAAVAKNREMPICQDTGMIVAFVTVGQSVVVEGGGIEAAINEGVRRGYEKGYLRKSVVADPLLRTNTKDNTPAVVYFEVVEGDCFKIELAAKGFGSENMSKLAMLKPADGVEGVEAFVVETVKAAGPNPCPPIVVGVGLGGTVDKAAQIAKKALLRPLGASNAQAHLAELEERLLEKINALGIGPQGLGGNTTALAVHVEAFPTHIAGLPVVVNINCHASRHAVIEL
ncbi:fumarate hydratase [Fusibacter sp. JL298sf-3]